MLTDCFTQLSLKKPRGGLPPTRPSPVGSVVDLDDGA
jgi:hypothetical protein